MTKIPIIWYFNVSFISGIITAAFTAVFFILRKRLMKHKGLSLLMSAFLIISAAAGITSYITFRHYKALAVKYGAYDDFYETETISSIRDNTEKGFIDQSGSLPTDLSGSILIYFRYGCNDCKATHDDITEAVKGHKDVYFVSTRSATGRLLIQKYPAEVVPSGTYIYSGEGNNCFTLKLYDTSDGKTIYLDENMKTLMHLQQTETE